MNGNHFNALINSRYQFVLCTGKKKKKKQATIHENMFGAFMLDDTNMRDIKRMRETQNRCSHSRHEIDYEGNYGTRAHLMYFFFLPNKNF